MKKILSIIIPSYNMEKYIKKCLTSLLQTSEDIIKLLDIIVINDGSKDRTSDLAHEYEAKYPDIVHVIDKENGNYGSCVNRGLNELTGTFVRVLDADDYMDVNNIQSFCKMLMTLEDNVDLVISNYSKVTEDGTITKKYTFALPQNEKVDLDYCKKMKISFPLHSITYRSEIFKRFEYNQTEGISYTDLEWNILPMMFVRKVYYFNNLLTYYLVGRDGQTMNPDTYRRNYFLMNKIALKLACEGDKYLKTCNETSREYVIQSISSTINYIYYTNFWGWMNPFKKVDSNINDFDNKLKEVSPYFYNITEKFIISNRHYSFFPIKEYRNKKTKYTLSITRHYVYLCVLFLYIKMKNVIR